jgi:hypothetical protein
MADQTPSRSPMAGGFIIAIGVIGGALIGAVKGQPTIGFLIGFGIGAVIAAAIGLIGRRR